MPRYQDIARQLKTAIEQGELKPGARLPSSRTWSQELGASKMLMLSWWHKDGWYGGGRRAPLSASKYIPNNPLWMCLPLPVKASNRYHSRWDYPHSISFRESCGRG